MLLLGFARVSTREQDIATQVSALKLAGCEKIYSWKRRPVVDGTDPKRTLV
jgi:DNA invertase Pin-like site-specific DNA recombinase